MFLLWIFFAALSSSFASVSINVHEDCGVTSKWLTCLDHCEDHDIYRSGRAPWAEISCSSKCTKELAEAFEQETDLPSNPKFNTEKEKCLRRCWCDNTDTRFGLKGTPCHLACRYVM
ncbi:uncharacterized protein LOC131666328 [Phymastichus coffea]|uniref:uncharacterized protein LOC131666328 n=1 Tax=Phymastichus coffea TaxID=108790 RepID=UPI00273C4C0D|nr:uncharacterized protein LOC131666328 [Phymastichus coffea]